MKRLLALVLSVCLICSCLPFHAIALGSDPNDQIETQTENPIAPLSEAHTHGACICAITGASCSHTQLTWTEWTSTDSLPTAAGNYYLTGKVVLAETTTISENVNLCLNGFDIDLNEKKIINSGELTIMNCQAQLNEKNQLTSTAGKLYNGTGPNGDGITKMGGAIGTDGPLKLIGIHLNDNISLKASDARSGGAIYAQRTTVTIESCSFSGNEAKGSGGAISTYAGTLTIRDSLFANNTAQFRGGAICVNTNTATAATNVTITGNTEFTGNRTTSTGTTVFYGAGGAIFLYKNGTAHELYVTVSGNTKITGNTATQEGGGICLRNSSPTSPMQFKLQNDVQIYDNAGESSFDNLYFENSDQILKVDGLGTNANIHVATKTTITDPDEILTAAVAPAETDATGIFYDNNGKTVGYNTADTFCFVNPPSAVHTHGACSCILTEATCSHTQLTWTAWSDTTSLPTEAGNYFLTGNVTLAAVTDISAEVNICLNGKSIDLNGKKIANTGKLTIMNCQAQLNEKNQLTSASGKIYNGTHPTSGKDIQKYGGAIGTSGDLTLIGILFSNNLAKGGDARTGGALYVEAGMTTIESCKFTNNQALSSSTSNKNNGVGGAISVYKVGSLDITDSVFENNTADLYGGAICVNNSYATAGSSVTIDGNSVFTGNKTNSASDGYGSAMYLYNRSEDGGTLRVTIGGNTQISGNTAGKYGAVLLRTHAKAGQALDITICDNLSISGNTASSAERANLYFNDDGYTLKMGQLSKSAQVFVSTKSEAADPDDFLILASDVNLENTFATCIIYDRTNPDKIVGYNSDPAKKFFFVGDDDFEHAAHSACQCKFSGETCSHEALTWKPWISTDSLPTAAGNYFLVANVKLNATASVKEKVVLCMNGFSIDLNEKYISVGSTGDLTIVNCMAAAKANGQLDEEATVGGMIYNGKNTYGGAALVSNGGKLTAIGIAFCENNNYREGSLPEGQGGGAIHAEGTVNVYSCRFIGNTSNNHGGAISAYVYATVNIHDCYFSGNTAKLNGGALSVYTGGSSKANVTATISGDTEFVKNSTDGMGGAIYLRRHGNTPAAYAPKLIVKDVIKITGNKAGKGGGLAVYSSKVLAELELTDLVISGNTANSGGGIYAEKAKLVCNGVTITDNQVTGSGSAGGGITGQGSVITLQAGTVISGNSAQKGGGGGVYVSGASTIHMYDCTITKNESPDGGGVRLWRNSVLNMNGGAITENHATEVGGGVSLVKGSVLNLNDGEISKNTCTKNGAGVYADNYYQSTDTETYPLPQLNLAGGKISQNSTPGSYGGGIYAKNCQTVISGTVITKNSATKANGGGIYASKVAASVEVVENGKTVVKTVEFAPTFTMTGGEVSENKAKNAGGIYFNEVNATLSGGKVNNNYASENAGGVSVRTANLTLSGKTEIVGNTGKSGGGVILQVDSSMEMNGGVISGNSALNGGGMLLWSRSVLKMQAGNIRYNKATKGSGGGIYAQGGAHVKILGGFVTNNSVTSNGGGIYCTVTDKNTTRLTVAGGSIMENYAQNSGGGAYLNKGAVGDIYGGKWVANEVKVCGGGIYTNASRLNLYGGTFTKNHSEDCGAAINAKASKVLLDGAVITGNISDTRGGGIRIHTECTFTMKSGEISNNEAARGGAGIAIYSGGINIEGGEIVGNKVTGSELYPVPIGGGGILVYEGNTVYDQVDITINITGGEISNNYSLTNGGGIVLNGRTVMNISGGKITDNTAELMGGGIIVDTWYNPRAPRTILNVTGGEISGNTATDGAGIYARYSGEVNLDGATIQGNTASGVGGALHLGKGTKASLKNSLMTGNKAANAAGFYAIDDFQMHNLEVTENECASGHAVYIDKGEFDGRSYVLSIIKMTGDIRFHNNTAKNDLFIGENAKINVGLEGLGQNTLIHADLASGVLTNTVIGAYDYEGGSQKYTLTYGDRSMTELEPIPVAEQPEENEPSVNEPVQEPKQPDNSLLFILLSVAALAVILVIILLLMRKKKPGKDS